MILPEYDHPSHDRNRTHSQKTWVGQGSDVADQRQWEREYSSKWNNHKHAAGEKVPKCSIHMHPLQDLFETKLLI